MFSENVAAAGKTFHENFRDSAGTFYSLFQVQRGCEFVLILVVTVQSARDLLRSAELNFSLISQRWRSHKFVILGGWGSVYQKIENL